MFTWDIVAGNPGALTFIMEVGKINSYKAETCFSKMQEAGIVGDKLYMIWNDCCNRDTQKAIRMMMTEDVDTILHYINYENGYGIAWEEEENE